MKLRKILIADDFEMNRNLLKEILSGEYDILEADSGASALKILSREADDISAVLLDLVMPEIDGYGVLKQMRSNSAWSKIPVIVTTGSIDETSEVKALTLGANDYIAKPYNPSIIRHRLWNTINLRETAAMLNAVKIDALTGLLTRMAFFEEAGRIIAEHEPGYFVMSCCDIDRFKLINDQYGNQKGDEVLQYIGRILREAFEPEGGICSRINADNYAVLYPISLQNAGKLEEIQRKASIQDGTILPLSFSIGRYIVDDLSLTPSAMYDRASIAKASIKGRYDAHVAQYNEAMRERIFRQQEIISEMNGALEEQQFEIWLQPQFNRSSGALIGAEALVRWRHPQRGLVPPGEFIPLFEKNGFVYELDKYVWEQTCIVLRKWLDNNIDVIPVSVNISRYDILRSDIIPVIVGLTKKYRIPTELLRLEITESAFAKDDGKIIEVVQGLNNQGFMIEIDDFGSGYSSLNTLKSVPADVVKLDMRFLEDKGNSSKGGNILESIVRMTKWLGMSVIAEGVETIEQANFLKSIGCNYHQGYLYAKPMPVEEFEALSEKEDREMRLQTLETLETLDNNVFWDPKSIDTLIFNSYVGGAFIFEYYRGKIEILRVNDKYVQIFGGKCMSSDGALGVVWGEYADEKSARRAASVMQTAIDTGREVTDEMHLVGLRGPGKSTYLRTVMRVIAKTDERYLFYCMLEDLTAQRQAEQKEYEIAAQLSAIMKNINGGVTAITINEQNEIEYIFANDQYYEQLGYSRVQFREEVVSPFELVYPEDRERVISMTAKGSMEKKPFSVTYRAVRRDGSIIWIQSNISLAYFPEIDMPVQIAVANDITASRLMEQKEEEERKALLENLPCGAGIYEFYDNELTLKYVNKRYMELVGRNIDVNNRDISELEVVRADDRENLLRTLREAMNLGHRNECDIHILMGDGSYKLFHLVGNLEKNKNGKTTIYTTYMPISETELSYREMIPVALKMMMAASNDYMFIKDKNLSYICCSQAVAEMAGLKDEKEIVGKTDYDLFVPELADRYRREDRRLIEDDISMTDYVEIIHAKDGITHYLCTSKYILKDAAQNIIGIYGIGRDITESRNAYEKLKFLTDSMPGGLVMYEIQGESIKTLYSSEVINEITGYSQEEYGELSKDDPLRIVVEEDIPIIRESIVKLCATGTPIDCVYRIHTKSGEIKWINFRGNAADYEADRVIINALLIDISKRKNAEQRIEELEKEISVSELWESFTQLKLLTDSVPSGIGIYHYYTDGRLEQIYENNGYYAGLGTSREERACYDGFSVANAIHPDDMKRVALELEAAVREKRVASGDVRVLNGKGDYQWMNVQASVAHQSGDKYAIYASYSDVDRAKSDTMALEQLIEEELEAVLLLNVKTGKAHLIKAPKNSNAKSLEKTFTYDDIAQKIFRTAYRKKNAVNVPTSFPVKVWPSF